MKRRTRWDRCGLCGELRITTREHVVPRSLYPASKSNSRFQRITIAACVTCNNGTADDDAHFRNVVLVAGEPNEAVKELWSGPVRRGFAQVDGHRRARDIFDLMQPAPDVGPNRYRIFPADDPRILQIVRKIIRGLSRHHELAYPLSDGQVFADVMRQTIPEEILAAMEHKEAEPDVLQYGYLRLAGC
ncbi:hypothetical protein [Mesorhizobium sp. SARCC-RB16n]|uniref:hypothetical protein n=1 Tax=Mesorhizobium sp. SARCC-RB16n TaxID=2116687 RepID=UPI00122F9FDF|nr:hypothetical protein [Mesorhizobium sp. SARCC-RB16n]